jgi:tetratricopeptide (TPR) repeat protein
MEAELAGDKEEVAIQEFRAALLGELETRDEILAHASLAAALGYKASNSNQLKTLDDMVRSPLVCESIENMEKAVMLDEQYSLEFFAGLQRSKFRNFDAFCRMTARRKPDAIAFLESKVALVSYQKTCPLLHVAQELADRYRNIGRNGAAELALIRIVTSQPLHAFSGESHERERTVREEAAEKLRPTLEQRYIANGTFLAEKCRSCGDAIELNANFCTGCGTGAPKTVRTRGRDCIVEARVAAQQNQAGHAIEKFREALTLELEPNDEVNARAGLGDILSALAITSSTDTDDLGPSRLAKESIHHLETALRMDREYQTGLFAWAHRRELWNLDILYTLIAKQKATQDGIAAEIEYIQSKISLCDYQRTCPFLHAMYELGTIYHHAGDKESAERILGQLVFAQPVYVFGDERESNLRRDAGKALQTVMISKFKAALNEE